MAEIYLARQSSIEKFEKLVVIKQILPHLVENKDFIRMFINEANLAAQLHHQNIVDIYDLDKSEGIYYIAMEYIRGKDLTELVKQIQLKGKTLSVEHAVFIIKSVCRGLDYAHRKRDNNHKPLNIIHRDISPQNILLSYEGEVKLIDFGIAKATLNSSATKTGVLKGKWAYMSPEQAWGHPIDQRSDIFSTGTVLYELLTGIQLFKGDTDLNTLEKVRAAKVEPPPRKANDEIPKTLEDILFKSLAKNPEDRFQHACEMEKALGNFLQSTECRRASYTLADFLKEIFQKTMDKEDIEIRNYIEKQKTIASNDDKKETNVQFPQKEEKKDTNTNKPVTARIKLGIFLGMLLIGGVMLLKLLVESPQPIKYKGTSIIKATESDGKITIDGGSTESGTKKGEPVVNSQGKKAIEPVLKREVPRTVTKELKHAHNQSSKINISFEFEYLKNNNSIEEAGYPFKLTISIQNSYKEDKLVSSLLKFKLPGNSSIVFNNGNQTIIGTIPVNSTIKKEIYGEIRLNTKIARIEVPYQLGTKKLNWLISNENKAESISETGSFTIPLVN